MKGRRELFLNLFKRVVAGPLTTATNGPSIKWSKERSAGSKIAHSTSQRERKVEATDSGVWQCRWQLEWSCKSMAPR